MAKKNLQKCDFSSKAEIHDSAIIQQTPNGVLIVDSETNIQLVNPSFKEIFHCKNENMIGKKSSIYTHSDCFELAVKNNGRYLDKIHIPEHKIHFRVGIYPIEGEDLFCGIFIDISDEEEVKNQYKELKTQILDKAQDVITRQMKTAQEIARLLGETTAETKVILVKLMSLIKEEDNK